MDKQRPTATPPAGLDPAADEDGDRQRPVALTQDQIDALAAGTLDSSAFLIDATAEETSTVEAPAPDHPAPSEGAESAEIKAGPTIEPPSD